MTLIPVLRARILPAVAFAALVFQGGIASAADAPTPNGPVTYWLGTPLAGNPTTTVFNVRVPNDVATTVIRRNDDKAPGYKTFRRVVDGTNYEFFQNNLAWETNAAAGGMLSFIASNGAAGVTWVTVSREGDWPTFKAALDRLAKPYIESQPNNGWFKATPQIVAVNGTAAPTFRLNSVGPFDTAGAASEQATYHATKPQIVAVPVNGGLVVGWREYVGGKPGAARLTRYAIDGAARKTWEKTLPLPVLGGVTADGTNIYALCARDEDLGSDTTARSYRQGVLQLIKFDAQGDTVWAQDLNSERYLGPVNGNGQADRGIYSPFIAGTGQLVYGRGRLLVAMACNTLPDDFLRGSPQGPQRHQRAVFFTVGEDGSGSRSFAESSMRHSFDQRVLFDGTDFVISELADAGWYMPAAGIAIRKAMPGDDATTFTPSAAEGTYIYARRGNGDSYSNSSFTSLGDMATGDRGYVALFASQTGNGQPPASGFTSPVPEPRNLAMVHVVRNFETVVEERPNGQLNISKSVVDTNGPILEPITRADKPEMSFRQHGVVWLTNLPAGTSAERPRLVRIGEGKYLALWEEWIYQGTGQNLKHKATKAMLLGEYGNVLRQAATINARLNPAGADRPFAYGPSAAWLSGDNGAGKFTLHLVDENLTLNSYDIGL